MSVVLLLVGLVFIQSVPVYGQPPSAIQIKQKLQEEPLWKHKPIYKHIMKDTSVLDHPALRKQLIRTAEEWNKKLIRGRVLGLNEGFPEDVGRVSRIFRLFHDFTGQIDGRNGVDIWIQILPRSPVSFPDNNVFINIKKNGDYFLKQVLRRVTRERENKGYRDSMKETVVEENRSLYSGDIFPRLFYEVIRNESRNLPAGIKKRIKGFSWKIVKEDKKGLAGLKILSAAFLLDSGVNQSSIESIIKHPDVAVSDEITVKGSYIKKQQVEKAIEWRSEYPKWPIDESNLDDDPHKNQKGKGHEKGKGRGHQ